MLANGVANMCVQIGKRIKEKPHRNGTPVTHHVPINTKRIKNGSISRPKTPNKTLVGSRSVSRLKTPLHGTGILKSKSNVNLLKPIPKTPNRSLIKTKSTSNLRTAQTSTSRLNTSKLSSKTQRGLPSTKSSSNLLKRKYKTSTTLSKSNRNSMLGKEITDNLKPVGNHTPFPTKPNDDSTSLAVMESGIESGITYDETNLLSTPIPDMGFLSGVERCDDDLSTVNHTRTHVIMFNVEDFAKDHIGLITEFLKTPEVINLMLVNKSFSKLTTHQILSDLEKEKQTYEKKLTEFTEEAINESSKRKTLQLSKGAVKAINLLNESLLNKLFTERTVPSDDIILIYQIYFQLINHPIIKKKEHREEFWKSCCDYFLNSNDGKTGDLLQKNISDKILLSSENIYKLIHIVGNNVAKISPSYFSKLCGTTGLFAFFIKDVLDFLGISNDKKIQQNAYWTYNKMVKVIDSKIASMKKFT